MFRFETEQKVCEVGGVKFGGQPGEYLPGSLLSRPDYSNQPHDTGSQGVKIFPLDKSSCFAKVSILRDS